MARLFRISGRVQGVGFRFHAERVARLEGLSGYVRNLDDGDVEALVEGDLEAVRRFDLAIRQGPPGSRVTDVEVEHLAPSGATTGFTITG